jgi:CheY-like chemotaxis protein
MKILVLDKDLMERTVIQQVLQYNGHEIVPAENSETAMQLLQEGEIRFIIADRATTDIDEAQFIQRVRDAKAPYYIYILLRMAISPPLAQAQTITCTSRWFPSRSNPACRSANASSAWEITWCVPEIRSKRKRCSIRLRTS